MRDCVVEDFEEDRWEGNHIEVSMLLKPQAILILKTVRNRGEGFGPDGKPRKKISIELATKVVDTEGMSLF